MNYQETLTYLYACAPMFQQVGPGAYKEGLDNTRALDEHLGHPHRQYATIHVGGTNGKGSCSHTLAAMLQSAGYRVGLYTSPHLVDFRERIRVDGTPVEEAYVVDFVERHRAFFEPLHPSFFELTTALAFAYFAERKVDVAVVEVGLGGRLDCTNIIRPRLSIITNISFDHVQLLGHTLAQIATEKAGIIKAGIPTVIGEANEETRPVFEARAKEVGAPLVFAEDEHRLLRADRNDDGTWRYQAENLSDLRGELGGLCQLKNTNTLLAALPLLRQQGFRLTDKDVRTGLAEVVERTGLMGRWQQLEHRPDLVCDTGHNVGGIAYIAEQLRAGLRRYAHLHVVVGMVNDKDVSGVLALLPHEATYYFTQASVKRAMPVPELQAKARLAGLEGSCHASVAEAVEAAKRQAGAEDLIFVGGSTFVVADLLTARR